MDLTLDEQRTAVRAFNHCYTQSIWNWSKIINKQDGRDGLMAHLRKHQDKLAEAAGRKFTGLEVEKLADFVEANRSCPKDTRELDEEDLMSVFNDGKDEAWRLLMGRDTESPGE